MYFFLSWSVVILRLCVCVCLRAHVVRAPLFMRRGIISVVHWFNKKMVEMISRAQTSNTRGRLSYGASIDCKNKGGGGVNGMEIVEERDRWSRQKTSSPESAADSVRGLRLWGLCQSGSAGKVAPLRKRLERKRERDAGGCVGHWGSRW